MGLYIKIRIQTVKWGTWIRFSKLRILSAFKFQFSIIERLSFAYVIFLNKKLINRIVLINLFHINDLELWSNKRNCIIT